MDETNPIPDDEIFFRASRSGGPGGQHANRRATRVEACWNVEESAALDESQKRRVAKKLASRISQEGVLCATAEDERSQHRNKQLAQERLQQLVAEALRVPKRRVKTKPPRSADEKRLEEKRLRKRIKKLRKPPEPEE